MTANTKADVVCLVPAGTVVEASGQGGSLPLEALAAKALMIVLRIEGIIEQESLRVSVWGSTDGTSWGEEPLFTFPEKFYPGTTPAALALDQRPEIKFLRAHWEVNRWGRGYPLPHFKFALEIQELT